MNTTTKVLTRLFTALFTTLLMTLTQAVAAQSHQDQWKNQAIGVVKQQLPQLKALAESDKIVALLEQRLANLLTLEEILRRDYKWIATRPEERPALRPTDEAAGKLLDNTREQNMLISELLLLDANGATLYASPLPTDYWQGDEAKFIQPALHHNVYVGETGYDASSASFQVQVSVPVMKENGIFLGVVVAGIELPLSMLLELRVGD